MPRDGLQLLLLQQLLLLLLQLLLLLLLLLLQLLLRQYELGRIEIEVRKLRFQPRS